MRRSASSPLFLGQRDGEHRGAALAGRLHRQRAPARADLQQPAALADAGRVEHRVDLAELCGVQVAGAVGVGDRVEQRRGVGHRRVEEGLEHGVGQVVVRVRVVPRPAPVAVLVVRHVVGGQPAHLLQRRGDQVLQPGGQLGEQRHQLIARLGVPGAGLVGLAEADQAVGAEPVQELLRPPDPQHGPAAAGHPGAGQRQPVGRDDGHRDVLQCVGEKAARDPRADRSVRDAGQVRPAVGVDQRDRRDRRVGHGSAPRSGSVTERFSNVTRC